MRHFLSALPPGYVGSASIGAPSAPPSNRIGASAIVPTITAPDATSVNVQADDGYLPARDSTAPWVASSSHTGGHLAHYTGHRDGPPDSANVQGNDFFATP